MANKQVTIITAFEPDAPTKQKLITTVADKTATDVALIDCKVDASLLGGCIIQIDDMLIDLSLKKKLDDAKSSLNEHISV